MTIAGHGYRFTAPVTVLSHEHEHKHEAGTSHVPVQVCADAQVPATVQRKPPRLSILVLPLVNYCDQPARDWFTEGMTDSLVTELAHTHPTCTVFAYTSANVENGRPLDFREIASASGARYVLKGSTLTAGEHIRVNAQLVEAETGAHVWAERFDKHRASTLQAQDEIVGRLSRSVWLQMIACEARRAEQEEHERPDSMTALDHVLRGHAAASQPMMTRHGFATACMLYERALEHEPRDADALSGIAEVRGHQVLNWSGPLQ